jgi:hypothetical protein
LNITRNRVAVAVEAHDLQVRARKRVLELREESLPLVVEPGALLRAVTRLIERRTRQEQGRGDEGQGLQQLVHLDFLIVAR